MERKKIVAVACLGFMIVLVAGICVIIWSKTHDNNQPTHQITVRQLNLSQSTTLYIRQNKIHLSFLRMSEDHAHPADSNKTSSNVYLSHAGQNTSAMIIVDMWDTKGILKFKWIDGPSLRLKRIRETQSLGINCMNIQWKIPTGSKETPSDCFDMKQSYWFGGFEEAVQYWPINKENISTLPFVTGDGYALHNIGDMIEGLFLSSSGLGIYILDNSTTYINVNGRNPGLLCLYGGIGEGTPFFNKQTPTQTYDICESMNIVSLWKGMRKKYIPLPISRPSQEILSRPIWSTWARYKAKVNQDSVLEFANEIKDNNFKISQLELDDNWTPKYGDFIFSKEKFPNAKQLIANLTNKGIPLTVWMHPFFNNDSISFKELESRGLLLRQNHNSNKAALTKWWRGNHAGVLDVTNPEAVHWYLNKTKWLQREYGVKSFKFDAGEVNLLPQKYVFRNPIGNPNYFSKLYAEMAFRADKINKRQEVRTGFHSQNLPILFRMIDRDSNWGHDKGLRTLIPCALTMGLMGYPFILPDMVGGNAYDPNDIDVTVYPDPELFIRWLQTTTLMPTIQFSIPPWLYNKTITDISRKFTQLHESFSDKIQALAENAVSKGEPILRPLWWLSPEDPVALQIESEFLLGDDVLVCPVLDRGSVSRDIYLPKGKWRYDGTGKYEFFQGPVWLYDFPSAIDVLPYFTRVHLHW